MRWENINIDSSLITQCFSRQVISTSDNSARNCDDPSIAILYYRPTTAKWVAVSWWVCKYYVDKYCTRAKLSAEWRWTLKMLKLYKLLSTTAAAGRLIAVISSMVLKIVSRLLLLVFIVQRNCRMKLLSSSSRAQQKWYHVGDSDEVIWTLFGSLSSDFVCHHLLELLTKWDSRERSSWAVERDRCHAARCSFCCHVKYNLNCTIETSFVLQYKICARKVCCVKNL